MLSDQEARLVKYIDERQKKIGEVAWFELCFRFYTQNKDGNYESKDAVSAALDKLVEEGVLDCVSAGFRVNPIWKEMNSELLGKMNRITGVFEKVQYAQLKRDILTHLKKLKQEKEHLIQKAKKAMDHGLMDQSKVYAKQAQKTEYPMSHHNLFNELVNHKKHKMDDFKPAIDELIEEGKIDCFKDVGGFPSMHYALSDIWSNTESDNLTKINKKIGIFEMKHLKTFEGYDPDFAMTACPVCHSENCQADGNGNYECIDCGENFSDAPAMEEEEEDFIDTPAVSADELELYKNDSEMINKIIAIAAESNEVLADQLKYVSGNISDFDDFETEAIQAIQDIEGVDREAAVEVFDELYDLAVAAE